MDFSTKRLQRLHETQNVSLTVSSRSVFCLNRRRRMARVVCETVKQIRPRQRCYLERRQVDPCRSVSMIRSRVNRVLNGKGPDSHRIRACTIITEIADSSTGKNSNYETSQPLRYSLRRYLSASVVFVTFRLAASHSSDLPLR